MTWCDTQQTRHVVARALPKSSHMLEVAPLLILALTQEFNHGRLEPQSKQAPLTAHKDTVDQPVDIMPVEQIPRQNHW